MQEALEIVKAQAKVRAMTSEEMTSMVAYLTKQLHSISQTTCPVKSDQFLTPLAAIKEKSITCLECGKLFRIITARHLATHGLTPEEYRHRYGYDRDIALAAKDLVRARRNKINEMKLWERKGANKDDQG